MLLPCSSIRCLFASQGFPDLTTGRDTPDTGSLAGCSPPRGTSPPGSSSYLHAPSSSIGRRSQRTSALTQQLDLLGPEVAMGPMQGGALDAVVLGGNGMGSSSLNGGGGWGGGCSG